MNKIIKKLQGIISISSKGTGYVAIGNEKNKQDKRALRDRERTFAKLRRLKEYLNK